MSITKSIQKLLKANQHKKISLGLSRTKKALGHINWNKKKNSKVITIGGTSAKFSIINIIKKILVENNFSYAATFSPHIKSIVERIELNSKLISLRKLKKILVKIYSLPVNLTEFEKLCLAFAEYIKKKDVDYTLAEFGLFGRKDAIRALFPKPFIHIVSPIGFDHLHWTKNKKKNLKTLKEIVFEKTSFLKAKKIYIAKQSPTALKFIKYYLKNKKCYYYGKDFWLDKKDGEYFYCDKKQRFLINSNLLGDFMYQNAVLAIKVAIDEGIPLSVIKISLKTIKMNGRLQEIKTGKLKKILPKSSLLYADGAHNSLSSNSVCSALFQKYKHKNHYAIISMIKSKNPRSFLKPFKNFKKVFFVKMKQDNAFEKETLNQIAKNTKVNSSVSKNCYEAIRSVKKKSNSVFLITGSFYYLQEII